MAMMTFQNEQIVVYWYSTRQILKMQSMGMSWLSLPSVSVVYFTRGMIRLYWIYLTLDAPWCRHSKAWLPNLEKAAQKLSKLCSNVVLARIDASSDENKVVQDIYGISGFPTIFLFKKGVATLEMEYNGERTTDKFIKWLTFHTQTT